MSGAIETNATSTLRSPQDSITARKATTSMSQTRYPQLASTMSRLGTETAFSVLARAKELERAGKNIIHLEIGETVFDTTLNIVEADKRALDQGVTSYVPSAGILEARESIAQEVSKTRGVHVSAEQIVITPGAKPIMFFGITALCEPGDEVLYPDPGFPIYESMIRFVGAKPVPLSLRAENQFRLDIDELESKISSRTKLVIINSPQNPTGGMLTPGDIDRIAALLADRSLYVLSDEIYGRIVYGETEQTSIVSRPGMAEKTIILDGFSKTYAMTGWRLGYGVMNTELAAAIAQLQTNSTSCTAAFVQMAGIEALTGPQNEVDVFVNEFRHRRNVLVDGLNSIEGVDCQKPAGAFYVFPQLKGFRLSADEIATRLLDDAGVAVLSGTAFGTVGSDSLRLSFANSVENLEQAIDRIKDCLDQLR